MSLCNRVFCLLHYVVITKKKSPKATAVLSCLAYLGPKLLHVGVPYLFLWLKLSNFRRNVSYTNYFKNKL